MIVRALRPVVIAWKPLLVPLVSMSEIRLI